MPKAQDTVWRMGEAAAVNTRAASSQLKVALTTARRMGEAGDAKTRAAPSLL